MGNRIERIVVKNLFGELNYDIDLRNGQDISILIAPNGCGKTTIFKFIDFIFNPTFTKRREIEKIDFKCLRKFLRLGLANLTKGFKDFFYVGRSCEFFALEELPGSVCFCKKD